MFDLCSLLFLLLLQLLLFFISRVACFFRFLVVPVAKVETTPQAQVPEPSLVDIPFLLPYHTYLPYSLRLAWRRINN